MGLQGREVENVCRKGKLMLLALAEVKVKKRNGEVSWRRVIGFCGGV